jgi:DNA excision repair protein ERCC-2
MIMTHKQELNNYEPGNLIPAGVYTLDDVKKYGQEKGVCPYFTIRRMVSLLSYMTMKC